MNYRPLRQSNHRKPTMSCADAVASRMADTVNERNSWVQLKRELVRHGISAPQAMPGWDHNKWSSFLSEQRSRLAAAQRNSK